ncbi:response regulator transcription factor [Ornithinibacillus contaminans]|uniref:response regulator transcription factor n=1 Tax=Ornithinibacillus contaminans TaxID=694055 RepID=UPI00064DC8F4|nr:response regulator transcription factor [Ornithinibacillus contaminans]
MKQTILIVEDESVLREISKDYFEEEGYHVLEAGDGITALALFEKHAIDLIVLDIMMPKLNGWTVCKKVREKSVVPIIMLTARADEEDTLLGFELGADDYVTKPYSPRILLARANRLLSSQQSQITGANQDMLISNDLEVNLLSRSVKVNGEAVELTHTEYEILIYLMENKNIVITRDQLITRIWGYEYTGDDRTINTHMRNLRSKLGNCADLIKTIVRAGYKFEEK